MKIKIDEGMSGHPWGLIILGLGLLILMGYAAYLSCNCGC